MEVFHGTTLIVETPLVGVGRKNLDFGEGFYLTSIRQQAIDWAQRPINKDKPQYLNCYELDLDEISKNDYRYLKFEAYNDEWLDFVTGNRRGEMLWNSYDIVEGGIANDRVFNTIELYDAGLITREEALARLQYEKPNNQICLIRQELVDKYLVFKEAILLNDGK